MIPVVILIDQKLDDLLEEIMAREGLNKSDLIKKYLSIGLGKKNDSEPEGQIFSNF